MNQHIRFCTAPDGARIAYATLGSGAPLVKAANWLSHLEFDFESPVWRHWHRELSRDHLLVRYDERGCGLSDHEAKANDFDAWVGDLEAVVDAAGLDRFALLGISQGGPVAIAYAVRFPERVSHLVLYGSYGRGWARRVISPAERAEREAMITLTRSGWGREVPAFREPFTQTFIPDATDEQRRWFDELQRMTCSPENAVQFQYAMGNIDVTALLPQVKVPTLVLHARGDMRCPFEEGRELATAIPNSRFVSLDGRNHLLLEHEAAWAVFLREVRAFLGVNPAPSARSSSVAAGMRLGAYEITGLVGTGGMGEVYRAHDTRLDRDVALKVLPLDVAADEERLARFDREARALAALNHPNIVTIYSIEESAGIRFLTMELIEGKALDALIPSPGMALAQLFDVAVPLADALTAAHGKGIVHRDLKPANVMLDRSGRVKVLDFGLAKPAPAASTGASMTRLSTKAGLVVGTVPYMSPEQIEARPVDPRSDVFSFGVVLYEMAAGQRPFAGESSPALMSAILRDAPVPLADRRADVPEHLGRIVRRCLEKAPADRYQSMQDVHRELRDLQKESTSGAARRLGSGSAHAPRQSFRIAVSAFKAPAGDAEVQGFAEGLVEDVTAGFLKFPHLFVAKDAASARYRVEGSIRKSGTTVRVKVQLVDAEIGGAPLWAETYSRDLSSADIFAIQDDVTDRVVATVADVHGVLVRSMVESIRDTPLADLSSHELVLRYWDYHRNPKAPEHAELRAALERIAELEPGNADVWAALAWLYSHEYSHLFNRQPDPLDRARAAARRATDLQPSGQHGWETLAMTLFFDRDLEGFLEALDRTLSLNPRNTNAIAWMAFLLAHMGQHERGHTLVRRAMEINPQHPGWYHFVEVDYHYVRGEYAEALVALKRINMPEMVWMHLLSACVCAQLGRRDEARAAVLLTERMMPPFTSNTERFASHARWFGSPELAALFRDGYLKALAMAGER